MRLLLRIAPVAGLVTMIAAACSSPAPPPPDATVSAFCNDWAAAYCQIQACNFDSTTCTTAQLTYCNEFATQAQASGTRQYNQPNGLACIQALNAAFGNNPANVPASTLLQLEVTCGDAFIGNVQPGNSCSSNYDCVSPNICASVPGEEAQCGPQSSKSLGDACADPGDQCSGASYCAVVTGLGPKCVAAQAQGSQCTSSTVCGADAYCVGGTCQPLGSQGAVCSNDLQCTPGLYCDLYPPAACVTELTFARGSDDCNGIAAGIGPANPGTTIADAGIADSSSPTVDSSTPATDSSTPITDSATGG
ncbi:MAG: Dickkopf N-terminal cysteine-rich domain-containing protein [Polyangiaceae bacterium]|jgi:hypothetical protein